MACRAVVQSAPRTDELLRIPPGAQTLVSTMRADELRTFLNRPWSQLRKLKDAHHARRLDAAGAEEAFRLADGLREDSAALSAEERPRAREHDLRDLLELKRKLERISARRR